MAKKRYQMATLGHLFFYLKDLNATYLFKLS